MSLEIKNNLMIFSIPNSEAIVDIQRKTNKIRTVGSYYLSNLADQAEKFLNNLNGYFYVDLNASYLYCEEFFNDLCKNHFAGTGFVELHKLNRDFLSDFVGRIINYHHSAVIQMPYTLPTVRTFFENL